MPSATCPNCNRLVAFSVKQSELPCPYCDRDLKVEKTITYTLLLKQPTFEPYRPPFYVNTSRTGIIEKNPIVSRSPRLDIGRGSFDTSDRLDTNVHNLKDLHGVDASIYVPGSSSGKSSRSSGGGSGVSSTREEGDGSGLVILLVVALAGVLALAYLLP